MDHNFSIQLVYFIFSVIYLLPKIHETVISYPGFISPHCRFFNFLYFTLSSNKLSFKTGLFTWVNRRNKSCIMGRQWKILLVLVATWITLHYAVICSSSLFLFYQQYHAKTQFVKEESTKHLNHSSDREIWQELYWWSRKES